MSKRKSFIIRKLIPLLALAGFIFATTYTIGFANPKPPEPNQLAMPPGSPYLHTVSGTGLIEANSRNVNIGVYRSGIVDKIHVSEGQMVEAGGDLFRLDARVALAAIDIAKANVAEAQTNRDDAYDQLQRAQGLKVGLALSKDRLARLKFAFARAEAALKAATASLQQAEVAADQHIIRAPIKGRVLKVTTNVGEFVTSGGQSYMVLGNDTPLHVRVQIDENDLSRFVTDTKATAFVRGRADLKFDLALVRVEPFVIPKKTLSGDNAERVDTRILEVVYALANPENRPIYIGQQMDVFIDAGK